MTDKRYFNIRQCRRFRFLLTVNFAELEGYKLFMKLVEVSHRVRPPHLSLSCQHSRCRLPALKLDRPFLIRLEIASCSAAMQQQRFTQYWPTRFPFVSG